MVWGVRQPQEPGRRVGWCVLRAVRGSIAPGLALLALGCRGFAIQTHQPCCATPASFPPRAHQGPFPMAGGVSAGEGSPAVGAGGGRLLQADGWTAGPLADLPEQAQ